MQRLRSMAKFRRKQTSDLPRRNSSRPRSDSSVKANRRFQFLSSVLAVVSLSTAVTRVAAEDSPFYEADTDFRRERVVNQTLLRRPDLAVMLDRFEALANEEQWVEAAGIYQQLMDQPNDSFEWTSGQQIRTIRQLSADVFNRYRGLWSVYEQLYGSKAQALLDVNDADSCRHVARCYFETDAGRTAMLKLISNAWDKGELEQSIRGMTELLESRRHTRHLPEAFYARAHVAAATLDAPALESALSESRVARPEALLAMSRELSDYHTSIISDNSDWHHGRQLTSGTALKHSSPMSSVQWQILRQAFGLQPETESRTLRASLEDWSAQRSEQLQPAITSLFAVCAGDVLVFRDLDVISAYPLPSQSRASSEQPLWQYQSQSPLSVVYEQQVDPYTGITTSHPGLERLHISNSVISRLSTDGERIFAVEDIQRRPDPAFNRTAAYPPLDESSPAHHNAEDVAVLTNRLVALELSPETDTTSAAVPEWSIDYRGLLTRVDGPSDARPHDLAGHFFFGSPTISGTIAFVVSEFDSQICVSALESATGRLIWTQSISYVDRPLAHDVVRANQAIPLICTNGLILCDNGNGQLIALHADLGTLAWTVCYADSDSRQASGRWTYSQSTRYSHPGAFNYPVVCGDQVIVLPDRSQSIQCCDLRTGEALWSIPRKGAEYLAGVSTTHVDSQNREEEFLLVVGSHNCRAVNPETGENLWETQTGIVCGHGIQVGDVFLLPVADERSILPATPQESADSAARAGRSGQIIALNISDGRSVGSDLRLQDGRLDEQPSTSDRYQFPLGNLMSYRDLIVSVGIDRVVAFRQAGAVIRELNEVAKADALSETQLQTLAEAEVIMGRTDEAGRHLRQAMQLAMADRDTRQTTVNLYRELLYQKLEEDRRLSSRNESVALLEEIESLVENEEQRARFLVKEIEHLIVARDTAGLWQATDRFASIGLHIAIPASGHPGHVTTSTSWIPGIYSQLLGELSREERKKLIAEIRDDRLSQLGLLSVPQLETFLELLSDDFENQSVSVASGECSEEEGGWSESDSNEIHELRDHVARELAERAARTGAYQRAELILLSMKKSCLPATRHYAMQGLISLYSKLDCHTLAAANLAELSSSMDTMKRHTQLNWQPELFNADSGDSHFLKLLGHTTPDPEQLSVVSADQNFMVHFDRQHPTWRAYRQANGPLAPVQSVSITSRPSYPLLHDGPFMKSRLLHENTRQGWLMVHRTYERNELDSGSSEVLAAMQNSDDSSGSSVEEQHVMFLDRHTGRVRCEFVLPGSRVSLGNGTSKQTGHLLPVIAEGRLYGISLLEGKPIWERGVANHCSILASRSLSCTHDEAGVARYTPHHGVRCGDRKHRVELGPVGEGFCIVQTSRAVTCIDPGNGRLLWKRTDLNPQGGLWADRNTGLIGDEDVLAYFHPDQNTYTLLSTRTGEVLREMQLEHPPYHVQRTRQAFGRCMLYLAVSAESPHQRSLRLWDPKKEELLLDQPFGAHDLYHTSENEITLLLDNRHLKIFRPDEAEMVIDLVLDNDFDQANYLRVVRCGTRYLVNLYQTQRIDEADGYTSRFTDAPWDLTHINGQVLAVDTRTNELEWTRVLSHRSVVEDQGEDLPFLLLCATHQKRPGDQNRTLLLEVLDPATGNTLLSRNDLDMNRLLLLNHDRGQQTVVLSGLKEDLVINYGAEKLSRARRFLSREIIAAEMGRHDY
ncbi:outer membrane protein assembly factor BamB family protein [Rubinisphaera margarita]|uniref:outer membrane protein assembly factor BamB family protein n=1 Tax=Rubinisphaera margarita TaxID=2909586 RepID=UPI001EE8B3C8|nr:PQQ-binding-like beta-propeller repeat protein [Rubinisphaera margarita]MCG6154252.1 PQQ-binding-like beta-propeller repeat protein [Rubinisphaera margarita]